MPNTLPPRPRKRSRPRNMMETNATSMVSKVMKAVLSRSMSGRLQVSDKLDHEERSCERFKHNRSKISDFIFHPQGS
jgi:hypothetical protein